jgi:hypothetical protein
MINFTELVLVPVINKTLFLEAKKENGGWWTDRQSIAVG